MLLVSIGEVYGQVKLADRDYTASSSGLTSNAGSLAMLVAMGGLSSRVRTRVTPSCIWRRDLFCLSLAPVDVRIDVWITEVHVRIDVRIVDEGIAGIVRPVGGVAESSVYTRYSVLSIALSKDREGIVLEDQCNESGVAHSIAAASTTANRPCFFIVSSEELVVRLNCYLSRVPVSVAQTVSRIS